MRFYTHLQRQLEKKSNSMRYRYVVDSSKVDKLEDWVVAGITFIDYNENTRDLPLLTVYVYNFREGFKALTLNA